MTKIPDLSIAGAGRLVAKPAPTLPDLTGKNLSAIADVVYKDWKKVYFGAVPYLDALSALDGIDDAYGCDDARTIVLYFLSNATSWRGPVAKAVKAHLKKLAGVK